MRQIPNFAPHLLYGLGDCPPPKCISLNHKKQKMAKLSEKWLPAMTGWILWLSTSISTHTCTYIHTHICTCVCVHLFGETCTHTNTYTLTNTDSGINITSSDSSLQRLPLCSEASFSLSSGNHRSHISQDHKLDYVIHYSTRWRFIECLLFDSYSFEWLWTLLSERLAGRAVAERIPPLAILMPAGSRARGPLCSGPARLPTWVLQVLVGFGPRLGHAGQRVLHDLDVGDGAVALRELLGTLASTLAVLTDVFALAVAHDVAQGRLDKLLLQILGEDDLKTWRRAARGGKGRLQGRRPLKSVKRWQAGLWSC